MRRSDPGRGGQEPRRRPGGHGLASTIGPLAVGVLLALGWNVLVSQPHGAAGAEPGITRQVGRTVEEVAAQAWASTSPHAGPGATAPGGTGARTRPFGR